MGAFICCRLAEGMSLTKILQIDGMPSMMTIMNWLKAFADFREDYTLAPARFQQEVLCDELRDIADEGNPDEPWRAFLRVNSRKFLIMGMRGKYGVSHSRERLSEDEAPLQIEVITGVPDDGDGL